MKVQINQATPRILIAVYGTLRQHQRNWQRILQNKSEYLGTYSTDPVFTMYNTGSFPIVCDFGQSSIEYEVFEITDNETLNRIHALEGCSGIVNDRNSWYNIMPIETPHGRAYMYVQHTQIPLPVVESGNWNTRHYELQEQN